MVKERVSINSSITSKVYYFLVRYGIFFFFASFYTVIALIHPGFISPGNIIDILTETSVLSFVALGEAIVIAAGAVDLSLGNIASYGAMLTCYFISNQNLGVGWSIIIGVVVGGIIGVANGILISRMYMNSLIATLGTGFVLVGFLYMLTFGQNIMVFSETFDQIGMGSFLSIPIPLYAMGLMLVFCHVFMEKTRYGRQIQLIGGNMEACRLSGVPIKNLTCLAFVICGLLSPLSGILLSARQGLSNVDMGERFMLQAFTAAMLGTVILGGKNLIIGTFFGCIFLISLINGLALLGAGPQWTYFAQGALLLASILLNYYSKKVLSRRN